MIYNIEINQFAVIESGLDLDLTDIAILDFIRKFVGSSKAVRVDMKDGTYTWISHKLIMEEMPIIGIATERGIRKRLQKLQDAGLIVRSEEMSKPYYKINNKAYDLFFTEGCKNEQGVEQKFHQSRNESSTKVGTKVPPIINIIDNNNKDNNNKGIEEISEEYKPIMIDWLNYKKARKSSYANEKSIIACYKNLVRMSGGDPLIARAIVDQSMANNWQGLFPLKGDKNTNRQKLMDFSNKLEKMVTNERNDSDPF